MPLFPLHDKRLSPERLKIVLSSFARLRVGVIGDCCLNAYWDIAPKGFENEVNVTAERLVPGAAGNVAINLAAMGLGRVEIFGFTGSDMHGRELHRLLEAAGVHSSGLIDTETKRPTSATVHSLPPEKQPARYDFGKGSALLDADIKRLLTIFERRLPELDAVVVSQSSAPDNHASRLCAGLAPMVKKHPGKIWVIDCHNSPETFAGAVLRIDAHQAAAVNGSEFPQESAVPDAAASEAALALAAKTNMPVIVSRGERGCLVACDHAVIEVPALQVMRKMDPVGAGETLTAAVAAALAAGLTPPDAAAFGNIAASVTLQKCETTGTATPDEILEAAADPDFIFWPELAADRRHAKFFPNTEIENVSGAMPPKKITHAIFDHDGTISTLREGWEEIMEPMMVRAILGAEFETIDSATYQNVVARSREFIDKTTGIQTLIQMQGLAALVREFGFVPENEVLDPHGYKKIYNDELIKMVERRVERLRLGELEPRDFAMKGSIELLHALKKAGVVLYLASGTDEPDVKAEAAAMGYADLFEGHIYGSVGDITKDAKKMVLDRILDEIRQEAMAGVVAIGDGPVEIRETRKRGGFTIGLASDEVRRFGLNKNKRTRLIRAGCDWLIPDFSQLPALLKLLNVPG